MTIPYWFDDCCFEYNLRLRSLNPPAPFFFFKIALAIWGLLCLHTSSQYMNCELPDVKAGFRKGRGTRDQIANIHWIIQKKIFMTQITMMV